METAPKLYGRAHEVQTLVAAFAAARAGQRQAVFIRGPAGIGKSSLVSALRAEVGEEMLLAMGKFEIVQRGQPLLALHQALDGLARALLLTDAHQRQAWERHLRHAVGHVGQVLLDVAPLWGALIGPQAPLPELPARESQNRLISVLTRLLGAIGARTPLALFIDDLQWADTATLQLIKSVLTEAGDLPGLLVIGAYRDNEVTAEHPLQLLLAELQRLATGVHSVAVGTLRSADVQTMLEDACGGRLRNAAEVARFVAEERTDGNPLFVRELLSTLRDRGLLTQDGATGVWTCDLAAARSAEVPDNLAALLQKKLGNLTAAEQSLLAEAALLGNRFALTDLVSESVPQSAALSAMQSATRIGVIAPGDGGDSTYRFLHDRLQQAAIALLDATTQREYNLRLGMRRLASYAEEPNSARLFAVLEQLGAATELFVQRHHERVEELIALNVEGARAAKRSAAFKVALAYLKTARMLLGDKPAQSALLAQVILDQADCEYSAGEVEAALRHLDALQGKDIPTELRGKAGRLRVIALTAVGRFDEAIERGIQSLGELGLTIPRRPSRAQTAVAAARMLWHLRRANPATLAERPSIADPRIRYAFDILLAMGAPAFNSEQALYMYLVLVGVPLNLVHGNTPASGWVFVTTGMFLSGLNRFPQALRFVEAGRRFEATNTEGHFQAVVDFSSVAFVEFVTMPWAEFVDRLQQCYTLAINAGDRIYAAWASARVPAATLMLSLPEALARARQYRAFTAGTALEQQGMSLRGVQFFAARLAGWPDAAAEGDPLQAEEAAYQQAVRALGGTAAAQEAIFACMRCFVDGDHAGACAAVAEAMRLNAFRVLSSSFCLFLCVWGLLAHSAARLRKLPSVGVPRATRRRMRHKLAAIAHAGPEHYGWLHHLGAAVDHVARGDLRAASNATDAAVSEAGKQRLHAAQAALLEHMGMALAAQGFVAPARAALAQAGDAYAAWGALAKAQAMPQSSRLAAAPQTQSAAMPAPSRQLAAAIAALAAAPSLEALLSQAATCLAQASEATRGWLLLNELESEALPIAAAQGAGPAELMRMVARTGVQHPDPQAPNAPLYSREPYFAAHRPRSLACLPVPLAGQTVGCLYVESDDDPLPDAKLQALAPLLAAVALAARALHLQAGMGAEVAKRVEAYRQRQAGLLTQERVAAESEMAGGFAHEMRNGLSGAAYTLGMMAEVRGFAAAGYKPLTAEIAALAEDLSAIAPAESLLQLRAVGEQLQSYVEIIAGSVGRGLDITRQILDYAQTAAIIPGDVTCSLSQVVDEVLASMQADLQQRHIRCDVQSRSAAPAYVSHAHAAVIVRNLLANARDAMADNPQSKLRALRLTIAPLGDSAVTLTVEDTGSGIAADAQDKLFRPFFSTKGRQGTGLGLAFSRRLASIYGGDVQFSPAQQGSAFTLTLTRRPQG